MKSFIQQGLILMLLCIATKTSAQIKKAATPVKTKQIIATQSTAKSLATELLRSNTEQACKLISNELKAIGIQIESMEEESVYDHPKSNEKPGKLLEMRTSLRCSNKMQVDVLANASDQVQGVNWYLNNISPATFTATEKILGYRKWPLISNAVTSSLYFNNNLIAEVSEMGSSESDKAKFTYAINLTKTDRFISPTITKTFNTDSLTVHSNPEETGQSVVQFLKGQGIKFLYKSLNNILTNYEGKGISTVFGYTTTYMFGEGTSVTISCNKYQKLDGINFYFTDPLVHNKIKKWFRFNNWANGGEGDEEGDIIYNNNNLQCLNNDKDKYIQFTISPFINDIHTRYQNTNPIDASTLVSYYLNMEKNALKTLLTKEYVTMVSVDWTSRKMTYNAAAYPHEFYFRSPSDSLSYVVYEYKLSDTYSRIIYFSTGDKAYYEKMKSDLITQAKDPKSEVIINYSDKPFEKTRMYYIMIFSKAQEAVFADNKRKKEEALLAQQQREKEAAAEKARLKAERDAKTSADIQKVGDILIQGLEQIKKKGNK